MKSGVKCHVHLQVIHFIKNNKYNKIIYITLNVLVLEDGANIDENTLLSWCRENMPHFYCPKRIVFITELPKTSTGKVQKNILRDILAKE